MLLMTKLVARCFQYYCIVFRYPISNIIMQLRIMLSDSNSINTTHIELQLHIQLQNN